MAVLKCEPLIKELASNKPNAATAFNLSGTGVTNFRAFSAAYANTETLPVFAKNTDSSLWEESICTFTSGTPNTLVRTTILKSSNANAAVDFSGSATDISLSVGLSSYEAESIRLNKTDKLNTFAATTYNGDGTLASATINGDSWTFTYTAGKLATASKGGVLQRTYTWSGAQLTSVS